MKKNKFVKSIVLIICAIVCGVCLFKLVTITGENEKEINDVPIVQATTERVSNIDKSIEEEKAKKAAEEKKLAEWAKQEREKKEEAKKAEEIEAKKEEVVVEQSAPVQTTSSTSSYSYSEPSYYYEPEYEETEIEEDTIEVEEAQEETVEDVEEVTEEIKTENPVQTANGDVADQSPENFKRDGVRYDENGTRYTWYSSNVLYHYRTGEWHTDENGFYRTDDNNLVVASEDYPEGTIIDTPFGTAEVLDNGCDYGTVDFYTAY